LVLDTIGFTRQRSYPRPSFSKTRVKGRAYLDDPLWFALDIAACRPQVLPLDLARGVPFDRRAQDALAAAKRIARERNETPPGLTSTHFLLGLLELEGSLMGQLFTGIGPDLAERVIRRANEGLESIIAPLHSLPPKGGYQRILAWAQALARAQHGRPVTEYDLTRAALEVTSTIERILLQSGTSARACLEQLHHDAFESLEPRFPSAGDMAD
jgi:hypothetical protein